jgi:hypothetical protein
MEKLLLLLLIHYHHYCESNKGQGNKLCEQNLDVTIKLIGTYSKCLSFMVASRNSR